jgi:hypothetical protein
MPRQGQSHVRERNSKKRKKHKGEKTARYPGKEAEIIDDMGQQVYMKHVVMEPTLVHGDGELYGKSELHGEGEVHEGKLDDEREVHEGELGGEREVHEEGGLHEDGELHGVEEVQD